MDELWTHKFIGGHEIYTKDLMVKGNFVGEYYTWVYTNSQDFNLKAMMRIISGKLRNEGNQTYQTIMSCERGFRASLILTHS